VIGWPLGRNHDRANAGSLRIVSQLGEGTDNNAPLHAAGATILAHENTKKRMSTTQDVPILGLHFPPSPADALPQQTFASSYKLKANGEALTLQYFSPAHTDSDIYVHFEKPNVIHMGDTFFNGMYPFIDPGTGGKSTA
jgi:cyclase